MFTTGFKLYFGIAVGLFIAAIVHGYATGGGHVGPLTWGWKGGVGDHIGYVVLMGLSVVSGTLGLVLVAFRDADPAARDLFRPGKIVTNSGGPAVKREVVDPGRHTLTVDVHWERLALGNRDRGFGTFSITVSTDNSGCDD